MNILVIPDCHAKPGVSNRRFAWLNEYLQDETPDVVVCLGDLADMPSLSSYDGSTLTGNSRKKACFEGRTVAKDLDTANTAIQILQYNLGCRLVFLMGNHEDRINRATSLNPELRGTIPNLDLRKWDTIPFLQPHTIGGIAFAHYFVTGVMGKPVGGEYPAANLLKKQYRSCVMGHSHVWDTAIRTGSRKLFGLVAGCYLDPNQKEEYAGPAQALWTSGVTLLRDVSNGFPQGGWEFISIQRLQKSYG